MLSVRGSILDPTGASIPGATVRLETTVGALAAQSESDARGNFTLNNLTPGNYSLIVPTYSGFAAYTAPLRLTTSIANVKITLFTQSVHQEVNVDDTDQTLSTDSSANRDTVSVSGDDLRKIPVFDQDIVATLTPFLDSSAGSSGGTTIIVDGVEMKSVGVSASAIQEVRINNDPYSAEFTRPGRARIEITTKPGSPIFHFHGEANFIFRDAIFNAKITSPRPPTGDPLHLRRPHRRPCRSRRTHQLHRLRILPPAGHRLRRQRHRPQRPHQRKRPHPQPQLAVLHARHSRLLSQPSLIHRLQLRGLHQHERRSRRHHPPRGRLQPQLPRRRRHIQRSPHPHSQSHQPAPRHLREG
ncbi:carboxypeptidase regulatory-like domain-containing protein [Tunturiibacter gelidiferens]|uniref:carboxypeptidase-like regulatory domain-containing protein n=1 Tax=Tunturiibacter gelidiferens TaxID=3069689 RepID=UPI003D9B80DF